MFLAVDMPVYICCSNKLFFTATDANLKRILKNVRKGVSLSNDNFLS